MMGERRVMQEAYFTSSALSGTSQAARQAN